MKKLVFLLTILFFCGCSKSPLEQSLEKYVIDRADGIDMKYKLISYDYIDTLTVKNMIDSISEELPIMKSNPDLEDFKKKRNQEFVEFRTDPNYEEQIMRGNLKDASDWCTEIRVITEKADSLISNWNKVDRYSYDYNYLYWWYQKRSADFNMYDYDLAGQINTAFNIIKESKEKFNLLSSLLDKPKDDVYFYVVSHTYSIINPLIKKKITQTDNVYFDANHNYVKYESDTNFNDILEQVVK
jgi:hypothetical protein